MTKKIYILLIAFGFFMIPNAIFSCNSHAQKITATTEMFAKHDLEDGCNTKTSSKSDKHSCCDKKSSTDKDNTGCKGKCGHSNCTVSIIQFAIISFVANDLSLENYFSFPNKLNFCYLKTNISSGFYSLWLIPKIG